jgi:general secretion pathway protein E
MLGVMAQRLVRTLCSHCKRKVEVDVEAWQTLVGDNLNGKLEMPEHIYEPVGCDECRHTGYQGRQGIYELMRVTDELKTLVHDDAEIKVMRKQAQQQGMNLLRVSGAYKVAQGLTTIEEVLRVSPRDNN